MAFKLEICKRNINNLKKKWIIKTPLLLYIEKLYHICFQIFFHSISPYVMQNHYMNSDRLCYIYLFILKAALFMSTMNILKRMINPLK